MSQEHSPSNAIQQRFDWLYITVVLGGILLGYYLLPLISLVVTNPPGVVLRRMTDDVVVSAATTSLVASLISTGIATLFGLPLAYWLATIPKPVKTGLTALVVLPLVLPPIVSGMVILSVVGPNTIIGATANSYGLPLTRSTLGIVLAQTFVASPFVVITAKAAFENIDRRLEYASRALGKSRSATVRHVTLPLAWPGILAGITLAFARAIGEFGATIMLAYYPRTMPVQIWVSYTTLGLENAYPIAVILLGIAIVTILILNTLGTNPLE